MANIHTALDIPLDESTVIDNKCFIHSVQFQDAGLVWRTALPPHLTDPTSTPSPSTLDLYPHQHISQDNNNTPSYNINGYIQTIESLTNPNMSQWQQAIDTNSGHCYYYNETTQTTQWEPPSEGFIPSWEDSYVQEKEEAAAAAAAAAVEEVDIEEHHQDQPIDDEEEEEDIEYQGPSPFDLAIQSYIEFHSKNQQLQPRKETTGMMPHIPSPSIDQHLRFNDEDREEEEDGGEMGDGTDDKDDDGIESVGEVMVPESSSVAATETKKKRKRKKKKKKSNSNDKNRKGPDTRRPRWLPEDMPLHLKKYWLQRYSLFSKFDQGILLDEESWYSVTPEAIAKHQAERFLKIGGPDCIVVDPFAGAGGNAIQLALLVGKVIAIEIDQGRLDLLKNNAAVYGVENKIECIQGDFWHLKDQIKADFAFFSPPWGGPEYSQQSTYDPEIMGGEKTFALTRLLNAAFHDMGCSGAAVFLPRNTQLDQIITAASSSLIGSSNNGGGRCEVEREVLNGRVKAVTVYYGNLINGDEFDSSHILINGSGSGGKSMVVNDDDDGDDDGASGSGKGVHCCCVTS
jgi:hypothetical protein